VQRLKGASRAAAILSIVGWAGVSVAQLPVCAQPEPDQPAYTACLPGGRFVVVPLLTNLAIDQLMKADGTPIKRDGHELFQSMASEESREKNAALGEYLDRLEPLKLTRIDTSTGTLRLDVADEERSFSTTVVVGDAEHRLGLELPARLEGGYWRTPGVLQMAFWKGQRVSLTSKTTSGSEFSAEIECVSVSADGIRIVTSGPSVPDILVGFDPCE